MLAILRRFGEFIKGFGSKPKIHSDVINPMSMSQEDPRQAEIIKRTRKQIEENQELILARSLRPHSYECKDPLLCAKEVCWKFVPDVKVGKPKIVRKFANATDAQEDKAAQVKTTRGVSRKVDSNKGEKI